jgi:hypothetical protein
MDLATELQKIYDSEINVEISWFWDGGIIVRLGDKMNGCLAEENVTSSADILPWLQEAIAHFLPTSTYAQSLDEAVRSSAGGVFRSSTNRCTGALPALRRTVCQSSGLR